jgi:hypothetical protein
MFAKLILPGGKNHPEKTIFAGRGPVFSMEKTGFFHELAKTCQLWLEPVGKGDSSAQ